MPNLNTQILSSLTILLPDIHEQRSIALLFDAYDKKISSLELEILLLDELFRAMLEELMTGRLSATALIESEDQPPIPVPI